MAPDLIAARLTQDRSIKGLSGAAFADLAVAKIEAAKQIAALGPRLVPPDE
jgi:hypothetical protein